MVMDNFLVREGAMIPRWYGVAWRQMDRDCIVVMPVPFNILAGWARRSWHWLRWGVSKRSVLDEVVWVAYHRGHTDGSNERLQEMLHNRTEKRAREEAYDAGRRDTMEVFNIKVPDEFK